MKASKNKGASETVPAENKDDKSGSKPQSERTENIVAIIVFAFLILIGLGIFTKGFGLLDNGVDDSERVRVEISNSPFRGSPNASVLIIAFSDYECSFCKKAEQTINAVEKKYSDDIVYVFKNYPLTSIHPDAFNAALAALCAKEQDKFWEYHDYLFEHNDKLEVQYLKEYAKLLELDSARFDKCLDNQVYKAAVNQDMLVGQNAGVSSTPTFFINGIRLVGAQPEEEFIKVINSEIKHK